MENTNSANLDQQPLHASSSPPQSSKTFIIVVVTLLMVVVGVGGYILGANQNHTVQNQTQPVPPIAQPSPTPIQQIEPTATSVSSENGDSLQDIKYTLPQGWEAEIRKGGQNNEEGLFISPVSEGGYLWIRVYDYTGDMGRKEYYCKASKFCIKETYFTEMTIGNISGYEANALDNSGGGVERFGSKGNKFYIISIYRPPSPNEFENNYKKVLDSLIF